MKSQPKPEASLQPNSDTNVEAKDQVKAEAQNDAELSKDDSANRSSKPENDLEIPGEPKLTTPIVEKKRRGRKPAASQNKSETNKTVLNQDISSIEKSNPNETSEINEESGSNDRILITPTEVQKTRKKIDLKATSQVFNAIKRLFSACLSHQRVHW
jgi:preprotein translocase subunit SecD